MGSKRLFASCGAFLLFVCMWGAAAGESEKGGPDQLAKEEEKHLERLAAIDRLEELAKENKNDTLLEKVTMLRENEQRQFDKACARLKRPHGKSEESKKGGKKDDEDKADKGKPDEKVGRPKDEKEREKGKEGEAEEKRETPEGKGKGKGKPEEKDGTKAKHGKNR